MTQELLIEPYVNEEEVIKDLKLSGVQIDRCAEVQRRSTDARGNSIGPAFARYYVCHKGPLA